VNTCFILVNICSRLLNIFVPLSEYLFPINENLFSLSEYLFHLSNIYPPNPSVENYILLLYSMEMETGVKINDSAKASRTAHLERPWNGKYADRHPAAQT
jgi:hypothetical protein